MAPETSAIIDSGNDMSNLTKPLPAPVRTYGQANTWE